MIFFSPASFVLLLMNHHFVLGASLIRMMDHFLTSNVFKRGLTNYLNKHKFSNAEQDDLWDSLTRQAHEDQVLPQDITVKKIMDTWTLQTGFPVVKVVRNYNDKTAKLTQVSFHILAKFIVQDLISFIFFRSILNQNTFVMTCD